MLEPYLLQPCFHVAGRCDGTPKYGICLEAWQSEREARSSVVDGPRLRICVIYIYIYIYIYTHHYIHRRYHITIAEHANTPEGLTQAEAEFQGVEFSCPWGISWKMLSRRISAGIISVGSSGMPMRAPRPCPLAGTPNLPTNITPTNIAWLKLSGKFPVGLEISPL